MATNPFETIRSKAGDTTRSIRWYQDQVKKLSGLNPGSLLKSGQLTSTITPGNMYMFFYDAKFKDKLPFWDRFPLALPFKAVPGGFYGINLHYMPYLTRYKLLGQLHDFATDENLDENKRINVSWSILNSLSGIAPIKSAVKHYLNEHVSSRFVKINYDEWVIASQLPVEKFVGATKQEVWKNNRR